MANIYDRAVRALQPLIGDTGGAGQDPDKPLSYCCAPPCAHRSCAAVRALDDAGLLGYADLVEPQNRSVPADDPEILLDEDGDEWWPLPDGRYVCAGPEETCLPVAWPRWAVEQRWKAAPRFRLSTARSPLITAYMKQSGETA